MQYVYLAVAGLVGVSLYRWRRSLVTLIRYGLHPADTMTIMPNRRAVAVRVIRGGKEYTIYLPYSSAISVKMSNHRAYAVKDGYETLLDQPPGIRYMVTADELGVTNIKLVHNDGAVRQFSGSQPVTL